MRLDCTLKELITLIKGGTTSLDHSFFIKNITSLDQAGPHDIAFVFERGNASVFDDVSSDEIAKSKAGIIVATRAFTEEDRYLLVQDSLGAYTVLVEELEKRDLPRFLIDDKARIKEGVTLQDGVSVDAGTVVDRRTTIGQNTRIKALCSIGKDCVIGKNVLIHPHVVIGDRSIIGDNTIIHSGVVIGSDGFGYQVGKSGMRKIPQIGNVVIGAHVEIGANTAIDRAAFGSTIISDGVKIDNGVHIAHGVKIGPHTAIIAQTGIAGGAEIGAGCQIGGQVGIKDHVKIGNGVKIVSQSAVLKDIPDGAVVAGSPTVPFMQWKRMHIAATKLPHLVKKAETITDQLERHTSKKWWQRFLSR